MKSSFSAIADVTNHTVRIPPAGGQWSNMPATQAKTIDGRACTVRQLLANARYTIDFYQREYAWKERQVRELIDDLADRFLDYYDTHHERSDVEDCWNNGLGNRSGCHHVARDLWNLQRSRHFNHELEGR